MTEDFMEEVPCKLGKELDFTVEDGCGMRVIQVRQNGFSRDNDE